MVAASECNVARVLVVDDEPGLVRAYRRVLERAGIETKSAADGQEALELLAREAFDAVMSDIHMDRMDGIELLRAVRERHGELPFIVITGAPEVGTAVEALEGGALHYLYKPIEPQRLTEVALQAVSRWRARPDATAQIERRELEARFESALEKLWIAYQPIVSVRSRQVIAFEALCRSDEERLAHPGALLEAAERLERVHELGRAIRARAIAGLDRLPDGCLLFLNLHPMDLMDDDLLDPASSTGPSAARLVLEVTERRSLAEVSDLSGRVGALKSAGYRLAVDDLGAGYAGLSSFADLEPEVVKLDMSLVRDVDRHPVKRRLVESMVALAGEIDSKVVVEGVETAGEREVLTGIGCDWMQGYLFGRPAREPALPRF